MNVADTIKQKVYRLPPKAQAEVLEIVEQIEERYQTKDEKQTAHPLTLLGDIKIDFERSDLAARHDAYAHHKAEE
jgi:hypothetical protein